MDSKTKIPQPTVTLGKTRKVGRRGEHLKAGNRHPNVIAATEKFALARRSGTLPQNHSGKARSILSDKLKDALTLRVEIDGVPSDLTAGDVIAQQLVQEAMQPAMFGPNDVAFKAREMLFDRTEGRAVARQEISGPDGGPIEKIESHALVAKLLDESPPQLKARRITPELEASSGSAEPGPASGGKQ